ncbi:unnamed protein product [Lupinus luteus]|uniref:Uncharacterized protein n=1 Tax=Lupinus luteus TaxID=3873 RepID=A0AAV1WGB5_LUPLU
MWRGLTALGPHPLVTRRRRNGKSTKSVNGTLGTGVTSSKANKFAALIVDANVHGVENPNNGVIVSGPSSNNKKRIRVGNDVGTDPEEAVTNVIMAVNQGIHASTTGFKSGVNADMNFSQGVNTTKSMHGIKGGTKKDGYVKGAIQYGKNPQISKEGINGVVNVKANFNAISMCDNYKNPLSLMHSSHTSTNPNVPNSKPIPLEQQRDLGTISHVSKNDQQLDLPYNSNTPSAIPYVDDMHAGQVVQDESDDITLFSHPQMDIGQLSSKEVNANCQVEHMHHLKDVGEPIRVHEEDEISMDCH